MTWNALRLALLAVALAPALAPALAQSADLPRVAFLSLVVGADAPVFDTFKDELRALGQIEGKTFRFELEVAADSRSVPALAEAMVRSKPTILVALQVSVADALLRFTRTIPVVVVSSGNPLPLGWTTSLGRPSGNVTGVLDLIDDLAAKRVEILHDLVPAARRVGFLYQLGDRRFDIALASSAAAAQRLQMSVVPFGIGEAGDLTAALRAIEAAQLDGLIVVPSPGIISHRQEIIESALANRLPTLHGYAFEAQDGALAAYGTNTVENFQRAAQYVDRLLGGAKVADLPFDTPRDVTLTINRRTATAIGLEIPPDVLARADEVLE